ncbi:MAG: hypothetical protein VX248_14905 [Pseudomonadota bacterium]|nr:hypothetical protein [Pseudomonadota bacterium]
MRLTFLFFSVCLAIYFIFNLESVQLRLNEKLNRGKLAGIESCVISSGSELVSKETIRNHCSSQFHIQFYFDRMAEGKAGPIERDNVVFLEGDLNNFTSDKVTTWLEFEFRVYDEDGEENESNAEAFVWIEPNSSSEFSVRLPNVNPETIKDLPFCARDAEQGQRSSCMGWGISSQKGVNL